MTPLLELGSFFPAQESKVRQDPPCSTVQLQRLLGLIIWIHEPGKLEPMVSIIILHPEESCQCLNSVIK